MMSVEQGGTIPIPSGDPFHDALIKRLHMDDDRTRYWDALRYKGSTEHIEEFTLNDYLMGALSEAPPIPERSAETRRALLARGLGCLTIEMQVKEETEKRNYLATRLADHAEDDRMFSQRHLLKHYPGLANYDPHSHVILRAFFQAADETIIDRPLEHPYLREVYEEIVGTF